MNVWEKHEHDKSLWEDSEQSEAQNNWGTSVNEKAIYYKILNF